MHINLTRTSHILFFIVFLPVVSLGIGWLFFQLFPGLPFWIETVSPLAAYGMLYAFFERVAWHWPVFRWLGIVTAPDLRGRWIGEQQSSFRGADGKNVKSRVVLEIKQTFGSIAASTYYKRWRTTHCDGSFMQINGELHFVVLFESEPNSNHTGNESGNKGVVQLYFVPGDGTLLGHYFNSNGQYGEVVFARRSLTLRHRFDA